MHRSNRASNYLSLFAAGAILALAAGCQNNNSSDTATASGTGVGSTTNGMTRPVTLVSGLGPVNHRVTTTNDEAQRFFDQGLAYIFGFNHREAIRSFERAAELDPKMAMAHWGRAYAMGPNINLPEIDRDAAKAAYEAAQKAVSLSRYANEKERAYISAIAKRYSADPAADLKKHAVDYAAAMKALHQKWPDDVDAATLYAESMMNLRPWKLYKKDGTPEEGTPEIVATLESVLARNPDHIGANHYYIHAVEASTDPGKALPSARRLPMIAPNSGHLVHMPAHIYIRTGDYVSCIRINDLAARVDEKYIASSCCSIKARAGIYPAFYYSHNLHFLSMAAAMIGRAAQADDAAVKLAANVEPVVDTMPPAEQFSSFPLLLMVRQGQWDKILSVPQPKETRPVTTAVWHFARGMAHVGKKDASKAQAEMDAFTAAADRPKGIPIGNNVSENVLAIARHVLAGKIAQLKGDMNTAQGELEKAVAAEDALAYDEPPAWPWPVRESLGAHLLINAKNPTAAEAVFRADLVKVPNNPRSLLGLAQSLKAQNKEDAAKEQQARFEKMWEGGQMKLRVEEF
jgi:tetratricopeptide (TPR) repeat protein